MVPVVRCPSKDKRGDGDRPGLRPRCAWFIGSWKRPHRSRAGAFSRRSEGRPGGRTELGTDQTKVALQTQTHHNYNPYPLEPDTGKPGTNQVWAVRLSHRKAFYY